MTDGEDVYQFIYAEREKIYRYITGYRLMANFGKHYGESGLRDILKPLIENGKINISGSLDKLEKARYWVRRDPNRRTPAEDKGGFREPSTPSHSLKLMNHYMRTDLILDIHQQIRAEMKAHPKRSPIQHMIRGIKHVKDAWKSTNLFECVTKNPLHYDPLFEFAAQEDFEHDIRLMEFHLNALRGIWKRINAEDVC